MEERKAAKPDHSVSDTPFSKALANRLGNTNNNLWNEMCELTGK
jgi:hypothetical protein